MNPYLRTSSQWKDSPAISADEEAASRGELLPMPSARRIISANSDTSATSGRIVDVDRSFPRNESFINDHPYALVNDKSYRQRTNTMLKNRAASWNEKLNDVTTQRQSEATIEDAFRLVQRACEEEERKKYKEAINLFVEGGEVLSTAAEMETNTQIQDLLLHKAYEVLGWAEQLASWMEQGESTPPPKRKAKTVAADIGGFHERASVNGQDIPDADDLMHYTPVTTANPIDFTQDGYLLQSLAAGRQPSLMIVITMYNEDENELSSTLRKVCNNIQYLTDRSLPGYEGADAWKNVLVCIVSDGRKKANPGTLGYLNEIGLFDEDVMNIASTGVDVNLHLFERVVNLNKTHKEKQATPFPPLQLVFALKEHNAGKLNSHLWYFNAFVAQVNPEYTGLLDVGTMPTKSAFYRLLSNMEINSQIGGVCGEIAVDKPIPNLCNFIIAAQHYEYKVSNILDKSMESCFGYISVLPGAFSAYRYAAIKGAPLEAYFKSLTTPMAELGPFQGNMYLAEDRILAFEVLAKKNCKWTMHYVKDAIARTDVPTDLTSLIGQRRRWLNGSFFAMLFGIMQWYRVYTESGHHPIRKLAFTIQYIYMVIQTCLNWFLPSAFYLAIYYVVVAGFNDDQWGFIETKDISSSVKDLLSAVVNGTFGIAIIVQLVLGLGNKPKHMEPAYKITSVFLAVLMSFAFVVAILIFISADRFTEFQIFFATAILGVYFLSSAIHCELHHICMAFVQYMLLLPTFVFILMVYSFCNLHDLSWGTKGIDSGGHGHEVVKADAGTYEDVVARKKAEEERKKREAAEADALKKSFDSFRSNLLLLWIFCNTAMVGFCIYYVSADQFLPILYIVVGSFNIFRFFGSIAYLIYLGRQWMVFHCYLWCGVLKRRYDNKTRQRENEMGEALHASYEKMP